MSTGTYLADPPHGTSLPLDRPAPGPGSGPTVSLMDVKIAAVTEAEAVRTIVDAAEAGHGHWTITANLDHVRRYHSDPVQKDLIEEADLVVADGMPLVWASRLAGGPLPERVAGSRMVWSICQEANHRGQSIFLLGADHGVAEQAAKVFRERYPGLAIAGTACPSLGFERDTLELERLRHNVTEAAPDIVFVALGFPKQDLLIRNLRSSLPHASFVGVGISLNYVTGELSSAPDWICRLGLEWAFRLSQEPTRRLVNRYLVAGFPFALRLMTAAALERVSRRPSHHGERAAAHLPAEHLPPATLPPEHPPLERLAREALPPEADRVSGSHNGSRPSRAKPTRIAYLIGARPNFVKMAPVISELRNRMPDGVHSIVHTGQHYDRLMSEIFLEELGVPQPDFTLDVGSGSHAVQTARVMERLEPVLEHLRPDLLIVPGDVNSTLAATLVAVKLGIPIAHLESGLRSFDRTMPEEINRIVADEFSDVLFLHSEEAVTNLRAEGIERERMHFVGNTMIDSLVAMEERFRNFHTALSLGISPRDYLLVTLHRPALVDGPMLAGVIASLNSISSELPVVFPVHPRTRRMIDRLDIETSAAVCLTPPLPYLEFLSLESDALAVLTDSGGVQEETTFLGVPCFTLRDNTERPVTVRAGTNTLLGLAPDRISDILPGLDSPKLIAKAPHLWDGRAAGRVGDVICGSQAPAVAMASSGDALLQSG